MFKQIREFVEFYPDSDATYWDRELEANFTAAKALSDVVGILVQLSFLSVAIKYFFRRVETCDSWFRFASFGSCLLVMALLAGALIYKISSLIAGFLLQGVVHQKQRWAKYVILVFAILQTVLIMNGVNQLIDDLSGTHALERAMRADE